MIVIYGIREMLDPIKSELSLIIHKCMNTVIGLPDDKRAHRIIPMDKENFYYPSGRSDSYTVIEINMMAGRTKDTKKELIKEIFKQVEDGLKIKPIDLEITIKEQPPHCWGFRGITGDEAADLNYEVNV